MSRYLQGYPVYGDQRVCLTEKNELTVAAEREANRISTEALPKRYIAPDSYENMDEVNLVSKDVDLSTHDDDGNGSPIWI